MELIVIFVIVWLIAPIPLSILYAGSKSKLKKRDILLKHLYEQERIDGVELHAAGVKLKHPAPLSVSAPVPAAQQEPVQQPEGTLSAAAERAKLIAESELNGTPLPEVPVSLEKPAQPEASAEAQTPAEPAAAPVSETVTPAAETPAPDFQTVRPAAEIPVPVQPAFQPVQTEPRTSVFSPISILLSVGVVLIIVAGLIFVRSAWGTMADGAKLLTLAAGGTLFFGTSAVAGRGLKLERTCTAFYTLGAVFFPISIWTAGFFDLLGSGLSGASNARLYALSFAAFTLCAFIAVKIFRQKSWGIASLCGLTAAVWAIAVAIAQHIPVNVSESDRTLRYAGAIAAAAAYALIMAVACRPLKKHLPDEINAFSEIFAVVIACVTALNMPVLEAVRGRSLVCACVVFLMLAVFCMPVLTDKLKNISAVPLTLLGMYGFRFLFDPLRWNSMTEKGLHTEERFAMYCIICAVIWLLMLLTKALPDTVKKGAVVSGYVLSGLAVVSQLAAQADNHMSLVIPAAAVILIVLTVICSGKDVKQPNRWLLAAEVLAVCTDIEALLVRNKIASEPYAEVVLCGMLLVCFAGFALLKRWRSVVSDLLFPIAAVFSAFLASDSAAYHFPVKVLSVAAVLVAAAAFWLLAMEKGSEKPVQYVHAVLMPAACGFAALMANELFIMSRSEEGFLQLVWSIVMYAAGIATVLVSKKNFNTVRRLMTLLAAVPPVYAAVTGNVRIFGADLIRMQIVGVIAAVIFWQLLERRTLEKTAAAAFGAGLFLAAEATFCVLRQYMYDGALNFTELLVASVWILAAALAAIAENKYAFAFTGSRSICNVGRIFAPAAALILSFVLLLFHGDATDHFYYIYTLAFVAVSWLTAKPKQVIMPCYSAFALILTAEAIRHHGGTTEPGNPVLLLFIMCGMVILFPYLGKVLRENTGEEEERRSWSLTAVGGLVPIWLAAVAEQGDYEETVLRWLAFFIPILAAGFLLHFVPEARTEQQRKGLITATSALLMVAFWIQPFLDVEDTYFEGKLHLLPLIAFGIVLRKLYGAETGGGFLFAIGVYSMIRLGINAAVTEESADLLTVLGAGFGIFTGSFYVKQKKWFLLGAASLLLCAMYIHMKMDSKAWWVYLLVIGLLLLVIGAVNEMLKQRGESLKAKAGRLWEEWRW